MRLYTNNNKGGKKMRQRIYGLFGWGWKNENIENEEEMEK